MSDANKTQVGGSHYVSEIQHWDYVVANQLDYFQAQITKYVTRWKKKNGLQDLLKAQHFLNKYIEVVKAQQGRASVFAALASQPFKVQNDLLTAQQEVDKFIRDQHAPTPPYAPRHPYDRNFDDEHRLGGHIQPGNIRG